MSQVPKFGSFKPKTNAADAAAKRSTPTTTHHDRETESERRSKHRHHRAEERRPVGGSKSQSHRDAVHSKYDGHRHSKADVLVDEFEESDLYIIDKRGDAKNVEYGSLHRYSIPTHHRAGYGRIIGAPLVRINRDESSETSVLLALTDSSRDERSGRPLTMRGRMEGSTKKLRLIAPTAADAELDPLDDFVPLRPNLKRKRGVESPEVSNEAIKQVDYRSIEGKAASESHPEDEDLEFAAESDEDGVADPVELSIRQKNAALSKAVKEHSADVTAWSALIEHQASMIRPSVDSVVPAALTYVERRAVADVRLAIYERALKHINRGMAGHDLLTLGMLDEGSLVWDNTKLTSRWRDILEENPSSVTLWTKHLDYIQTKHVVFTYEKCKSAYMECLNILHTALVRDPEGKESDIWVNQIYVCLRFTCFIRDSGYDELANAIWQILLEYQFGTISSPIDSNDALGTLEDIWESGVPRIGEEGALDRLKHREPPQVPSNKSLASTKPVEPEHPFSDFAETEAESLRSLHLPAAEDDEDNEDPYRCVLFSDLREIIAALLMKLPASTLLNAFLIYMRLPLLPDSSDDAAYGWQIDPFVYALPADLVTSGRTDGRAFDSHTIQHLRPTTFALFQDAFQPYKGSRSVEYSGESERFIDRVLETLVHLQPNDDVLAEYWMAFKLHLFPSDVAKCATMLLKARPRSLRLYNAYALSKAQQGRLDKARDIWTAAITLANKLGENEKRDSVLLWHNWMRIELAHQHESRALQCLLTMSEVGHDGGSSVDDGSSNIELTATPAQKLKCTSYLRSHAEQAAYERRWCHTALYVECLAHFAYLTDGMNLEAAVDVHATYVKRQQSNAQTVELLYQARADLIRLHLDRKRPYKPAMLRAELERGVKLFPHNSACLDLLESMDAKLPVTDRLRASIQNQNISYQELGIVYWSCCVGREIRRYQKVETSGSTQHSVRKVFLNALQDPESMIKHSPTLWKMWFDFERELLSDQAHRRAKHVFLDGLRYLPWSKAWVIMGLQYLAADGETKERESRQVYDVLTERELRIRVEVDV